jgi:hypothetical protein
MSPDTWGLLGVGGVLFAALIVKTLDILLTTVIQFFALL